MLGSDALKFQHNNTTYRTGQKLPPCGNYDLCFQIYWETTRAAQCAKSCSLTKVIDLFIEIVSFEHKYVIIKGLLHSEQLKQHMVTIGVDQ